MDKSFLFKIDGQELGPYTLDEIKILGVTGSTLVLCPKSSNWLPLSMCPELYKEFLATKTFEEVPQVTQDLRYDFHVYSKPSPTKRHPSSYIALGFVSLFALLTIFLSIRHFTEISDYNDAELDETIRQAAIPSDENFHPYVNEFYAILDEHQVTYSKPSKVIIEFAELSVIGEEFLGIAVGFEKEDRIEIYIDYDSWIEMSQATRKLLMFHELAHDVLNAEHSPYLPAYEDALMYPEMDAEHTPTYQEVDQIMERFCEDQRSGGFNHWYYGILRFFF